MHVYKWKMSIEYVPDLRLSESELAPLFPLSHWLGMCVITGIATENEGREAGGANEVGTEVNVPGWASHPLFFHALFNSTSHST